MTICRPILLLSFFCGACLMSLTAADSAEVKQDLNKIRKEIKTTEGTIKKSASKKSQASQRLQNLKKELAHKKKVSRDLQRNQRDLTSKRDRARQEAQRLHEKSRVLAAHIDDGLLDQWQAHSVATGTQWKDSYQPYVIQAQGKSLEQLQRKATSQQQIETQSSRKLQVLTTRTKQITQATNKLARQHQSQQKLVSTLDRQISTNAKKLAVLKKNEQRLNLIVRRLQEKRRKSSSATAAPRNLHQPLLSAQPENPGSIFARSKGSYPPPINTRGVAERNGAFYAAPAGETVHAIATGKVVYADALKGYGQMIILDHGEGFISVYGFCNNIRVAVGDQVRAKAALAEVGREDADVKTGLYFEIRSDNRPLNPLPWLQQ